ncbi:hypothetical protein Hanom_Chr01g00039531 [Helianthus anomalus]
MCKIRDIPTCWAFWPLAAVEVAYQLITGKLLKYSNVQVFRAVNPGPMSQTKVVTRLVMVELVYDEVYNNLKEERHGGSVCDVG